MCSMNDDPSILDEKMKWCFTHNRYEDMTLPDDGGPVEIKEDDPSVQHEPVIDDAQFAQITQCANPNCACKGPSQRNDFISDAERRRYEWHMRNRRARTTE